MEKLDYMCYRWDRMYPTLKALKDDMDEEMLQMVITKSHLKKEKYKIFVHGYNADVNTFFVGLLLDDMAFGKMQRYWAFGGKVGSGVYWQNWDRRYKPRIIVVELITEVGSPVYILDGLWQDMNKQDSVRYATRGEKEAIFKAIYISYINCMNQIKDYEDWQKRNPGKKLRITNCKGEDVGAY